MADQALTGKTFIFHVIRGPMEFDGKLRFDENTTDSFLSGDIIAQGTGEKIEFAGTLAHGNPRQLNFTGTGIVNGFGPTWTFIGWGYSFGLPQERQRLVGTVLVRGSTETRAALQSEEPVASWDAEAEGE